MSQGHETVRTRHDRTPPIPLTSLLSPHVPGRRGPHEYQIPLSLYTCVLFVVSVTSGCRSGRKKDPCSLRLRKVWKLQSTPVHRTESVTLYLFSTHTVKIFFACFWLCAKKSRRGDDVTDRYRTYLPGRTHESTGIVGSQEVCGCHLDPWSTLSSGRRSPRNNGVVSYWVGVILRYGPAEVTQNPVTHLSFTRK